MGEETQSDASRKWRLEKQDRCRTLLIQLLMEWELRPGSEVTNIMFCIYIIYIQGWIQEIFLDHPPREAGQRRTRGALRALHIPLTGTPGGGAHKGGSHI